MQDKIKSELEAKLVQQEAALAQEKQTLAEEKKARETSTKSFEEKQAKEKHDNEVKIQKLTSEIEELKKTHEKVILNLNEKNTAELRILSEKNSGELHKLETKIDEIRKEQLNAIAKKDQEISELKSMLTSDKEEQL